jgi:hypothetical protein
MAAGYARALGEPEAEMVRLLATAAAAAKIVFQRRGELKSSVTHLPSFEEESFVDTSATNPDTFVQALYAALAAGQSELLTYLAALTPADYQSEQATVSPLLDGYSRLLGQMVSAQSLTENTEIKSLLSRWQNSAGPGDQYWLAQLLVLERLAEADAAGLPAALAELDRALQAHYAAPESRHDPDRFLALPLLGLTALARRLGVL